MNLREYINALEEFAKENPEAEELEVIYSHDDEGNCFQRVYYTGTLGYYDGEYKGEFHSKQNIEEDYDEEEIEDYPINAVCIN